MPFGKLSKIIQPKKLKNSSHETHLAFHAIKGACERD